jgi:hypothetical protein
MLCIFNTFSVFLIQYLCINQLHMAYDVRAWRKSGPWSPLGKYVLYTACSTHFTTGLACTLSITREYMEHGGCLPANCTLTVYYLPVFPPYSDYNYGLWPSHSKNTEVQIRRTIKTTTIIVFLLSRSQQLIIPCTCTCREPFTTIKIFDE